MSKEIRKGLIITSIFVFIPAWFVLLLSTTHIWLMLSPAWLGILYFLLNFLLDKMAEYKNAKYMKYIVRILIAAGVAFLLYGALLIIRKYR
ncbi:hypothetical protein [Anaerocolumna aminovalerica]|uniref:hypothetical protein n=1 Tax=Anaerocolumna aminovalerica TaxID=1527 RepID=UPI000BE40874|nr:hypothetical protein [Anaerocolumna aminovalerica]